MNRTPDALQTELQAAEWLIRLEADASEENLANWRLWLGKNARHRAAYLRLESGWRETDCLKRLRPLDGNVRLDLLDTFPGLRRALPSPYGKPALYKKLAATTLAAILAAAALMLAV